MTRHRSEFPSTPVWPIGTALVLPIGTVGLALIVAGWVAPGAVARGFVRIFSYAVVVLLIVGLMLILVGLKRGSRRLRRPTVWISIVLSIVVSIGMLFTQHRAAEMTPADAHAPGIAPDMPPPAD